MTECMYTEEEILELIRDETLYRWGLELQCSITNNAEADQVE